MFSRFSKVLAVFLLLIGVTEAQIVSPPTGVSTGGTNVWTGSNTFTDNLFTLKDNTTPTKLAQFQLDQLTAGTRTFTLPPSSGTVLVSGQTITLPTVSNYTPFFGVGAGTSYAFTTGGTNSVSGRSTLFTVEGNNARIRGRVTQTSSPPMMTETLHTWATFGANQTATLTNGMSYPYQGYSAGFGIASSSVDTDYYNTRFNVAGFSTTTVTEPLRPMTNGAWNWITGARPTLGNNSYTGTTSCNLVWGGAASEQNVRGGSAKTIDIVIDDDDTSITAGYAYIIGDGWTKYETIDISAGAGTYTSALTYSTVNVIKTGGVSTLTADEVINADWTGAAVAATSPTTFWENPTNGWYATVSNYLTSDVYTFVDTVSVNGQVKIGVDVAETVSHLVCAINDAGCTEGAGQDYMAAAASTVGVATDSGGGAMDITAAVACGDLNNSPSIVAYDPGYSVIYPMVNAAWQNGEGGRLLDPSTLVNKSPTQFLETGVGPIYPMSNETVLKCADPMGCEIELPGGSNINNYLGTTVVLTAKKANEQLGFNPVTVVSTATQWLEAENEPGGNTADFTMREYDSIALRGDIYYTGWPFWSGFWKELWRNGPMFQQGFSPLGSSVVTTIEATSTVNDLRLQLPNDTYPNGTDTIALKDDALDNEAEDSLRQNSKWLKSIIDGGYVLAQPVSFTNPPDTVKVTVDDPTDDQNPAMRVQVCGFLTNADSIAAFRTCETLVFADEGNQTTTTEFIALGEIKTNSLVDAAGDVTIAAEWTSDALAIFGATAPVEHGATDFVPVPGSVILTMNYTSLKCLDEAGCDFEPAAASEDGKELIIYVLAGSETITVTESATMKLEAGPYTLDDYDTMRFIYNGTDAIWAMTAISQN